jgi:hypothetical protein
LRRIRSQPGGLLGRSGAALNGAEGTHTR